MGRLRRKDDDRASVVYHFSGGRTATFDGVSEMELLIEAALRRVGGPAKLAELLGTTRQTIHSWKTGAVVPDLAIQAILSRASEIVKFE